MELRIGVFLCDCGKSLRNIDFPKVIVAAEKCPDVVHVGLSSDLCLREGIEEMLSNIKGKDINRVVIAACSPELKEEAFRRALEEAGLNPNFLSMANIREQCSWAHDGDVTEKAVELIGMAVEKARFLKPLEKTEIPVNKDVLVVGGGFSGMKAALDLSNLGFRTTLIESASVLGGKLGEFEGFYGFKISPRETLSLIRKAVEESRDIEVLTSAELTRGAGEVGNFSVRIKKGKEEFSRSFGAIIFATGYRGEFSRNDFQLRPGVNLISQQKLVEMLRSPERLDRRPETIGFVLDVSDENSRLPTLSTLNDALAVKEKLGSEVYVLCKSLKVDSEGAERLYREVRDRGVMFLKFEERPRISSDDGRVKVELKDVLLGDEVTLFCDFLVAEERILPSEGTKALSSMLNTRIDSRGFCQDENVHLYPVSCERKGIFSVGACRGDLDIARASTDIASAVMSTYELLAAGRAVVEAEKVKVDPQKCRTCLTCIRVCPHGAIRLVRVDTEREVAQISDLACEGCGICAAICPAKAIEFEGYADEQILAEVQAIGERL
jgi:heterodisulfide reductase subunit A